MNKEEIKQAIQQLSKSKGFYCRVLQAIEENPMILDDLEKQNFNDVIDMVMFLEQ